MNKTLIAAGAAVCVLSAPLVAIIGLGGNDQASATSVILNVGMVPAAYAPWVTKAATTCATITGPVIAAQIQQESGWNPAAKSPVGAEGISQFMPGTWVTWGVNANPDQDTTADPYDPADAIMTQAKYDCALAEQVKKLIAAHQASGDVLSLTLAAYNAGIGAVQQYGGIPPYPETQGYVKSIEALMAKYTAIGPGGPGSSFGNAVIAAARKWIGTPYSWGGGSTTGPTFGSGEGAGTDGFDCSGLTLYAVYQASGGRTLLPHSSQAQATMGTQETLSTMQPGDLIAIQTEPGTYSHVVIYVGGGQILEAPKTGELVRLAPLSEYQGDVMTIRRMG